MPIFPSLSKAIAPVEPETGYTGLLVWFSMAPKLDRGVVDASASIMVRPYRILKDGTIDVAPESMTETYNVGSAAETALLKDPASAKLATAMNDLSAMLQKLFGS